MDEKTLLENRRYEIEQSQRRAKMDSLLSRIHAVLQRAYGPYLWHVEPSLDLSVVTIRLMGVSGNWGMIMHTQNIDDNLVRNSAGELLERYRLKRHGRLDLAGISDAYTRTNARGEPIGDS